MWDWGGGVHVVSRTNTFDKVRKKIVKLPV